MCINFVGGRQFKITKSDLIVVHRIPADVGSKIALEKVIIVLLEINAKTDCLNRAIIDRTICQC